MMRPWFKAVMLSCLIIPSAFTASNAQREKSSESLADHISSSKPKDSKDTGWLADLSGLPSREEIEKLSKHVDEVMAQEKSKQCTKINPRLRKMIFLHFATYQHMANARSVYLTEQNAEHWAHVFAMLLKESSGDTTSITSMTGRTYTTYQSNSDLDRWRKVAKLSKTGKIPLNEQTNFGLTQLSVDRLFVALKFAQDPAYLKGEDIKDLNTAIAIRRLIWFYQDFTQGRLTEEQDRIHHREKGNPEYSARFAFGTSMALLLCGTHYMFYEGYHSKANGVADLSEAMSSIAYCPLGNPNDGYGVNEVHERCFAKWVTLCPALNFDIALLTPLRYFATRNAAPVCTTTFKALLKKKPTEHKKTAAIKQHHNSQANSQHVAPVQHKTLGTRIKTILHSASTLFSNLFTGPAHTQSKNE